MARCLEIGRTGDWRLIDNTHSSGLSRKALYSGLLWTSDRQRDRKTRAEREAVTTIRRRPFGQAVNFGETKKQVPKWTNFVIREFKPRLWSLSKFNC